MGSWLSRYLSLDDLWSLVGFALILSVNQLVKNPMPLASISLLASGMLAILWLVSQPIRQRNQQRGPNVRVVIWGLIAVVSAVVSYR